MRSIAGAILAAWLGCAASPAAAQDGGAAGALFQSWLEIFNTGDPAQIGAFYGEHFGDPDPVYPLEVAEDSCGFDLVRIVAESETQLVALVAERCFPGLQRITLDLGPAAEGRAPTLTLQPYALSAQGAADYVIATAARLAEKDKFAGTLLIVPNGGEGWSRSIGHADLAREVPITADTPFLLASAGKMFTTVAILQLVEAGRVELDAPLGRYLPDYPNADMAQVTIRQLLTHRGGTGDMGILARADGANRARVSSIADIVALNGSRAPSFPPGSRGEYGNYGMLLLGSVVESVSGTDYYDYVQRHIFDRAGMTHAGFPLVQDMGEVAIGLTTFYGEEDGLVPNIDVLPWRGTPAGGGVASANDMLRFFRALQAGELLSAEAFAQAQVPSETPGWGPGFVVDPGRSWGHGGNSYGMDVAAHHYLPNDTTFICLATRDLVCNRLIYAWVFRTFGLTE